MERNDELGLDLAPFRSYDPAIGRWLQVDPMAEMMPSLTPYRFGFNNPVLWSDPLGLFESRREARRYRRQEKNGLNWFNSSISKQKDGSYAIETSNSSTQKNTLGDIMSNAVVGQTEGGDDVTTVALAGSKDIMPSTGEGNTLFTVELARFRDGSSLTSERPMLIPGGSAASKGVSSVVKMGSSNAPKAIRTLTKQIKKHVDKLINYRSNPQAYDNMRRLENISKEMQNQRIQGRIRKLQREIRKFVRERNKLKDN